MNQESASLEIKVVIGAKRNEICEFLADGSLKLKIRSKPIEGRANQELIEFLSNETQIPRSDITIVRGNHSRHKVLRFNGISQTDLDSRLKELSNRQDP
jgi:uncharacterized protein (TIGR00251 family)